MSTIEAWQWLVAFASPYLIALINHPGWSSTAKRAVMIGVSVVVAFVTSWLAGDLDGVTWQTVLPYLVVFIGAAQLSYSALKAVPAGDSSLLAVESFGVGKTEATGTGDPHP